jgi:hypothetical protein
VADAIIMDHVASSSVRFAAPTCPGLDVAWDGFRELGIWAKPGSRLLKSNINDLHAGVTITLKHLLISLDFPGSS